jgi:hypothetical protein
MAEEVEWFVGIDWASQSHQVCLVDAHGACLGERAVAHGGAGIEELCDWLIARTGATPEVTSATGSPNFMRLMRSIPPAMNTASSPDSACISHGLGLRTRTPQTKCGDQFPRAMNGQCRLHQRSR